MLIAIYLRRARAWAWGSFTAANVLWLGVILAPLLELWPDFTGYWDWVVRMVNADAPDGPFDPIDMARIIIAIFWPPIVGGILGLLVYFGFLLYARIVFKMWP